MIQRTGVQRSAPGGRMKRTYLSGPMTGLPPLQHPSRSALTRLFLCLETQIIEPTAKGQPLPIAGATPL